MQEFDDQALRDLGKMMGIDFDKVPKPKKPHPNQKSIDEISKMLGRYGG